MAYLHDHGHRRGRLQVHNHMVRHECLVRSRSSWRGSMERRCTRDCIEKKLRIDNECKLTGALEGRSSDGIGYQER